MMMMMKRMMVMKKVETGRWRTSELESFLLQRRPACKIRPQINKEGKGKKEKLLTHIQQCVLKVDIIAKFVPQTSPSQGSAWWLPGVHSSRCEGRFNATRVDDLKDLGQPARAKDWAVKGVFCHPPPQLVVAGRQEQGAQIRSRHIRSLSKCRTHGGLWPPRWRRKSGSQLPPFPCPQGSASTARPPLQSPRQHVGQFWDRCQPTASLQGSSSPQPDPIWPLSGTTWWPPRPLLQHSSPDPLGTAQSWAFFRLQRRARRSKVLLSGGKLCTCTQCWSAPNGTKNVRPKAMELWRRESLRWHMSLHFVITP